MSAEPAEQRPNYKWLVAAIVGSGVFMSTLSQSSLNVTMPTIAREFGVDLTTVQWLSLGYGLGMTSLLLSMARLADIMGRRRMYLIGYVIFGAGAIICSVMPDVYLIISGRVFQSIGAAMLQSTGAALLVAAFPASQRGRAMGIIGSFVSTGILMGPVVGGLLTEVAGWRANFLVGVPVGLLGLIVGGRILREARGARGESFDYLGGVLLALWIAPLIFLLNQGQQAGWDSPRVVASGALLAIAVVSFFYVERRRVQPIVDLAIFKVREFSLSVGIALMTSMARASSTLLTPFLLQLLLGIPVGQVGFMMALVPLGGMLLAFVGGASADRWGPQLPSTLGLLFMAGGIASLGFVESTTSLVNVGARLLVVGMGQGLFISPNLSSIMGSLPRSKLAIAGGFEAWSRTFGVSVGQATWGSIFAVVVISASGASVALDADTQFLEQGFRAVYLSAAGLMLLAAVLSSFRGRVDHPKKRAASV
ncbi:MAG: MFS transporter [Chloroflexota bacterium]|nr:MFS transporter [Chloroflexota bacterium]